MAKLPHSPLSKSQREIMDIVWDRGEISAIEVRELLAKRREVARETVRTLLTRMEEKGWLKHRTIGRTYFYSATVERETNVGQRAVELIDSLCGGSAERLMTALLHHRGLTGDEADRIQELIAKAKASQPKRRK